ncbi:MAG: 16S rRNA (cytosine(1402)-N(4))-methyltransferase RsmH [Bacilli bacterium]
MDNESQIHKRRIRYQGTHPKNYKEKYKELQPEKYGDTILKVIKKGNTPAGMHIPICVKEIMEVLKIKPGQIGLDATLGYGGHTEEILKRLDSKGHLYALDVDSIEIVKTKQRLENLGYKESIFTAFHLNFSNVEQIISETGLFNFVIADLGVSSMQIDNPDRGFSYKKEGPLDLRLDPNKEITATQRLASITQEELQGMLIENSDEPYAKIISQAITSEIEKGTIISTTTKLRNIIEESLNFIPSAQNDVIKKSCQRTFQALRIDINDEFEALYAFLEKLPNILEKDAIVTILTFHSGEDRLVKKHFKQLFKDGIYKEISSEVIRPSIEECNRNPRAHCAKLRWAIKA